MFLDLLTFLSASRRANPNLLLCRLESESYLQGKKSLDTGAGHRRGMHKSLSMQYSLLARCADLVALAVEQAGDHVFMLCKLHLSACYTRQAIFWSTLVQHLQRAYVFLLLDILMGSKLAGPPSVFTANMLGVCAPSCVVSVFVQGLPQGGLAYPRLTQMWWMALLMKEYLVACDSDMVTQVATHRRKAECTHTCCQLA